MYHWLQNQKSTAHFMMTLFPAFFLCFPSKNVLFSVHSFVTTKFDLVFTQLRIYSSILIFTQIGFIGVVEEEWLVTLATVDREEVTYLDFVTEGTKLARELRQEVRTTLEVLVVL